MICYQSLKLLYDLSVFISSSSKCMNRQVCNKIIKCIAHICMLIPLLSCSINNGGLVCTLVIRNHIFEPDKIYAKANTKIELIVKNLDDTIEEFESVSLRREKIVPANSTVKIKLPPLKPGVYKFFGEFHEETAQGELIVE